MTIKQYAMGALLCASLASTALISGCSNSDGRSADSLLAPTAGANPFPAVTNSTLLQFFNSGFASTVGNVNLLVDGPSSSTTAIHAPQSALPQVTNGAVTLGNLTYLLNDKGIPAMSGTIFPASGQAAGVNVTSVFSTVITPDHKFAYALSSVQRTPRLANITPTVSNTTQAAANATAIAIAGANATATVNATAVGILTEEFGGETTLQTLAVNPKTGVLEAPPFALNTRIFNTNVNLRGAVVHPNGDYLYLFGDRLSNNVSGAVPGVVEVDGPVQNQVSYNITVGDARNQVNNGTVFFVPRATSDGKALGRKGFILKFTLQRSTGEPLDTTLQAYDLPDGVASPTTAVFGPGGKDLYFACYNGSSNANGRANNSSVLHYRLGVGGTLPANPAGVATPTTTVTLPRGATGLAFSQGSKRLYATCQIGEATFAGGDGSPNTGEPTGGTGSIRCLSVDATTGAIARQASGDMVGLAFPGEIVSHPVFDRLYVVENGRLFDTAGNATAAGAATGSPVSGTAAVRAITIDSATGVLTTRDRLPRVSANQEFISSLNIDPTGQILVSKAWPSPLQVDPGAVSALINATGDVPQTQAGGYTSIQILADGTLKPIEFLTLPLNRGSLSPVHLLTTQTP